MGYKTINIKPQETKESLASELARALGDELGWTVSENEVISESGMRFIFNVAASISCAVGNGIATASCAASGSFSTSENWIIDVVTSAATTAIGVRSASTAAAKIGAIIARNTSGGFAGIITSTNTPTIIKPSWSTNKTVNVPSNTAEGMATSLVLYPDVYGGCMFEDLYMVYSCPLNTTDKVIHIDGKNFRYIGVSGSYGFALAV